MNNSSNKIIIILGPTSSGKSGVAIRLAKKFNGEIISADSRQVYRGLDIGSGKEPGDYDIKNKVYISSGVPHYGIDIASPKTDFNAAKFKKYSDKVIADILKRGKLPIICGGTGFWIKAVVDNVSYPEVKPDPVLRSMLRNKSKEELFKTLEKLDPKRAKNIDAKNPVRLIRAIEICKTLGHVPQPVGGKNFCPLQIGIDIPKENLHERIRKRLQERFASGMIEEVEKLHFKDKISWKRLESFGLGYRLIPQYLKEKNKDKNKLFEEIYQAEKDYAKRQMTWFKKDKRIVWLPACRRGRERYDEIEKTVFDFLK